MCGTGPSADHLLLTEVRYTPNSVEFVELHNPTSLTVNLTDYYLYNATRVSYVNDAGVTVPEQGYWHIVDGTQYYGSTTYDFALRFPQGATISPGEYQVVALNGSAGYCDAGCALLPSYEVGATDPSVPDMLGQWDTSSAAAANGLLTAASTGGEELVLFHWDGVAQRVDDVDYFIYGSRPDTRVCKTGVGSYLQETSIGLQDAMVGGHTNSQSYQRVCLNEGAELKSRGNGLTGHDETSENLSATWKVDVPTPRAQTAP